MNKSPLSILILVKNAAATLEQTLKSCQFAEEIIILNDASTDNSLAIAAKHHAKVIDAKEIGFAKKRNQLAAEASNDWLLFIDADEVITPKLQPEIESIINTDSPRVYRVRRRNFFLGKEMYSDAVERLFHQSLFLGYEGEVHEHPNVKEGEKVINLLNPLIHNTHLSITSMLSKTNEWSEIEAKLRLEAGHPAMAWWRLVRIGITTYFGQYVGKKLFRFGREGLFEAYFQMVDKLIVYVKLWEKQRSKDLGKH
jgi:glycosyltransferase involved in cell wall biosynthesis